MPHEQDATIPSEKHPVDKKLSHSALPAKGPIQPPGRLYSNHLGARGLHPSGALARTLWQSDNDEIENTPPGDSIRIARRLGGYCRGPNTGVPNEVGLITIEH